MLKAIRSPSSKFHLFLILTLSHLIISTYSRCYDQNYPDAISNKKVWRDCQMVDELTDDKLSSDVATTANSTNMFVVTFSCGVNDTVLCGKVKTAFETAGQLISSVVNLNVPVTVNASFFDFCKVLNSCPTPGGFFILGGASPRSTLLLQDDDGLIRHYPQALVKQFQFPSHPQFGPFDIIAMFNSGGPQFRFIGDPAIAPNQQDFLYVVLHELFHGLGFVSNWQDYFNDVATSLTPEPLVSGDAVGPVAFGGFFESAFDKYMIDTKTSTRMSSITDQLNGFAGQIPLDKGLPFNSLNELVSKFTSSSVYQLTTEMLTRSITPNSLGFLPHDKTSVSDVAVLETSLSPYQQGSSVSHMDINTYNNTSDFLMKFLADHGLTLAQLVALRCGGNNNEDLSNLALAIGPKLLTVMETMGYSTKNYQSQYKPSVTLEKNSLTNSSSSIQPSGTGTTATNTNVSTSKSSSMAIKPNLISTSIFVIISMLIRLTIYQS